MRPLLILFVCLVAAGCGKHTAGSPDIDAMIEAEDSARIAVWDPEQVIVDTMPHSLFYDSVLKYIRASVPVEIQKRQAARVLIEKAPLLPQNLATAFARTASRKALTGFTESISTANTTLENGLASLQMYLKRDLDSMMHHDTVKIAAALHELTRREILEPSWRHSFDSLEQRLVTTSLAVLDLVDTNASEIVFDTVLRFRNQDLAHSFDSLRTVIAHTADAESRIVREAAERDKNAGALQPAPADKPKDTSLARPF